MTEFSCDDVDVKICENTITICVCYASWKNKGSRELIDFLKEEDFDDDVGIILLSMDDEDEQEVALGLNMTEIPSIHIYKKGGKLFSVLKDENLVIDKVRQIVNNLIRIGSVAPPPDSEEHLDTVSKSYAGTLKGTQGLIE